jgi:hypothetical protein
MSEEEQMNYAIFELEGDRRVAQVDDQSMTTIQRRAFAVGAALKLAMANKSGGCSIANPGNWTDVELDQPIKVGWIESSSAGYEFQGDPYTHEVRLM